ncbi:MAG: hydrolase [Alphaproteobacteria bacterium]|nr:hydrolase [Alphaproteobacteria bacterium]
MPRCMLALDIQTYYRPGPGMVAQINQLAASMPTCATLFTHDESITPLVRFGRTPPMDTSVLVSTGAVIPKHGYGLPAQAVEWLKRQSPDEVLVVGGHTDANLLAAGFALFDAGLKPACVPVLNFGNDWYMHTVTTGIWEREIGKLYQSVAEFQFGGL